MLQVGIVNFIDLVQFPVLNGADQFRTIPEIFGQPLSFQSQDTLCDPYHLAGAVTVEKGDVIEVAAFIIHILPPENEKRINRMNLPVYLIPAMNFFRNCALKLSKKTSNL